jgi:hypothetical protein
LVVFDMRYSSGVSQTRKQQIATINYLLFLDNRGRRAVVHTTTTTYCCCRYERCWDVRRRVPAPILNFWFVCYFSIFQFFCESIDLKRPFNEHLFHVKSCLNWNCIYWSSVSACDLWLVIGDWWSGWAARID